ncbi:MAG: hypothetical protein KKA42_00910 [candidate division Zixibacteria bacterium]|nr:hypothetical protein [candidate division Zixibacteria bacterium]
MKTAACLTLIGILVLGTTPVFAQTSPKIGVRAGVGTDVNLGLAYGVGGNYLITRPNNSVELGIVLFGGSFEESTDESIHTYDETTDVFVFGIMANYLIGYQPDQSGTFFVAGFGFASMSVEWEERSATDGSLGTPLPGGGSMQSADGSSAGTLFNLGVGQSFTGGFDLRLEVPVIVSFSAPGESSSVIPTVIATAGYRF